jgi:endonuclease YncB( thermonuclease family)
MQDRIDFAEAQDYAKMNQLGLWADKNPTTPWGFRKQNKNN